MMPRWQRVFAPLVLGFLAARETTAEGGTVVFETTSVYHHIRVVEAARFRSLYFDSSEQSRIALGDPEAGRFEYIDYFFMPWLWNVAVTNVLMIGLGGGSAQQAYIRYCPGVTVETAEIDPAVLKVAEDYFGFRQSPRQRVVISDGRMFLQRSRAQYDAVLVDAYVEGRYGASIPYHLATQEFFRLVRDRLPANGVVAYNCIGMLQNDKADLVGALYRTMKSVFPQVYLFPARESWNVVLVGTRSGEVKQAHELWPNAMPAWQSGRLRLPTFFQRLGAFRVASPASSLNSPLLVDDYAPVDGLLEGTRSLPPQLRRQPGSPR